MPEEHFKLNIGLDAKALQEGLSAAINRAQDRLQKFAKETSELQVSLGPEVFGKGYAKTVGRINSAQDNLTKLQEVATETGQTLKADLGGGIRATAKPLTKAEQALKQLDDRLSGLGEKRKIKFAQELRQFKAPEAKNIGAARAKAAKQLREEYGRVDKILGSLLEGEEELTARMQAELQKRNSAIDQEVDERIEGIKRLSKAEGQAQSEQEQATRERNKKILKYQKNFYKKADKMQKDQAKERRQRQKQLLKEHERVDKERTKVDVKYQNLIEQQAKETNRFVNRSYEDRIDDAQRFHNKITEAEQKAVQEFEQSKKKELREASKSNRDKLDMVRTTLQQTERFYKKHYDEMTDEQRKELKKRHTKLDNATDEQAEEYAEDTRNFIKQLKKKENIAGGMWDRVGKGWKGSMAILVARGLARTFEYAGEKIGQAAQAIYRLGREAAITTDTLQAFVNAAGSNAYSALHRMRKAAGGMIDELTLLRSGTRAVVNQLDMNLYPQLVRISRAIAAVRDINPAEALERLTEAISRGQRRLLKPLALDIDFSQAEESFKEAHDIFQRELTKTEEVQARVLAIIAEGNRKIEDMGGVMDKTQSKFYTFEKSWEDLKLSVGEFINQTGIFNRVLDSLRDGLDLTTDIMTGQTSSVLEHRSAVIDDYQEMQSNIRVLKQSIATLSDLREVMEDENRTRDERQRAWENYQEQLRNIQSTLPKVITNQDKLHTVLENIKQGKYDKAIDKISGAIKRLRIRAGVAVEEEIQGTVTEALDAIDRLNAARYRLREEQAKAGEQTFWEAWTATTMTEPVLPRISTFSSIAEQQAEKTDKIFEKLFKNIESQAIEHTPALRALAYELLIGETDMLRLLSDIPPQATEAFNKLEATSRQHISEMVNEFLPNAKDAITTITGRMDLANKSFREALDEYMARHGELSQSNQKFLELVINTSGSIDDALRKAGLLGKLTRQSLEEATSGLETNLSKKKRDIKLSEAKLDLEAAQAEAQGDTTKETENSIEVLEQQREALTEYIEKLEEKEVRSEDAEAKEELLKEKITERFRIQEQIVEAEIKLQDDKTKKVLDNIKDEAKEKKANLSGTKDNLKKATEWVKFYEGLQTEHFEDNAEIRKYISLKLKEWTGKQETAKTDAILDRIDTGEEALERNLSFEAGALEEATGHVEYYEGLKTNYAKKSAKDIGITEVQLKKIRKKIQEKYTEWLKKQQSARTSNATDELSTRLDSIKDQISQSRKEIEAQEGLISVKQLIPQIEEVEKLKVLPGIKSAVGAKNYKDFRADVTQLVRGFYSSYRLDLIKESSKTIDQIDEIATDIEEKQQKLEEAVTPEKAKALELDIQQAQQQLSELKEEVNNVLKVLYILPGGLEAAKKSFDKLQDSTKKARTEVNDFKIAVEEAGKVGMDEWVGDQAVKVDKLLARLNKKIAARNSRFSGLLVDQFTKIDTQNEQAIGKIRELASAIKDGADAAEKSGHITEDQRKQLKKLGVDLEALIPRLKASGKANKQMITEDKLEDIEQYRTKLEGSIDTATGLEAKLNEINRNEKDKLAELAERRQEASAEASALEVQGKQNTAAQFRKIAKQLGTEKTQIGKYFDEQRQQATVDTAISTANQVVDVMTDAFSAIGASDEFTNLINQLGTLGTNLTKAISTGDPSAWVASAGSAIGLLSSAVSYYTDAAKKAEELEDTNEALAEYNVQWINNLDLAKKRLDELKERSKEISSDMQSLFTESIQAGISEGAQQADFSKLVQKWINSFVAGKIGKVIVDSLNIEDRLADVELLSPEQMAGRWKQSLDVLTDPEGTGERLMQWLGFGGEGTYKMREYYRDIRKNGLTVAELQTFAEKYPEVMKKAQAEEGAPDIIPGGTIETVKAQAPEFKTGITSIADDAKRLNEEVVPELIGAVGGVVEGISDSADKMGITTPTATFRAVTEPQANKMLVVLGKNSQYLADIAKTNRMIANNMSQFLNQAQAPVNINNVDQALAYTANNRPGANR